MVVGRVFTPTRVVFYLIVFALSLVFFYVTSVPRHDRYYGAVINFVPSSYNWADHTFQNPVNEMAMMPSGKAPKLPAIQNDFSTSFLRKRDHKDLRSKKEDIRRAFNKTWIAYEKNAWGHDGLKPLTNEGHDSHGGWATTMIESLDTLWIMDMKREFYKAVGHVAQIDWDKSTTDSCNIFATNSRLLGGLLSAYELSHEGVLLAKAIELGDLLYAAFDNPQHLPPNKVKFDDLKQGKATPKSRQSSAGIAGMTLEFTRLSQLTGVPKYYDAVTRITKEFARTQNETRIPGLWPAQIDAENDFQVSESVFNLGADGDALYDSLLKEHMLLKGQEPVYADMYREAADQIAEYMVFRPMLPAKDDIRMLGKVEVNSRKRVTLYPHLEHHSCFAGAMFAIGGRLLNRKDHITLGDKLARGCAYAYSVFPHGLMPEVSSLSPCPDLHACDFNPTFSTTIPLGFQPKDKHFHLRPEAIESLFVLYRVTGDDDFRDMAWSMWEAIQNATETDNAFAGVEDVTKPKVQRSNALESAWMAETLKYFWLIFSDEDELSLDKWVFNTQGHPFRRSLAKKRW